MGVVEPMGSVEYLYVVDPMTLRGSEKRPLASITLIGKGRRPASTSVALAERLFALSRWSGLFRKHTLSDTRGVYRGIDLTTHGVFMETL
jgi:hypothetical protein